MECLVLIIEQDVLYRLPAGILYRSIRAVCKRWKDLIESDPYFVSLHLKHQAARVENKPHVLGLWNRRVLKICNPFASGTQEISWTPAIHLRHLKRLDRATGGLFFGPGLRGGYCVVNPLTGALKCLPPAPNNEMFLTMAFSTRASQQRYWVCVVCELGFRDKQAFCLYDSAEMIWIKVDIPADVYSVWDGQGMDNGEMYFLCHMDMEQSMDCGVYRLNPEDLTWSLEWRGFLPVSAFDVKYFPTAAGHFITRDGEVLRLEKDGGNTVSKMGSFTGTRGTCSDKCMLVIAGLPEQVWILDVKTETWSRCVLRSNHRVPLACVLFTPSLLSP